MSGNRSADIELELPEESVDKAPPGPKRPRNRDSTIKAGSRNKKGKSWIRNSRKLTMHVVYCSECFKCSGTVYIVLISDICVTAPNTMMRLMWRNFALNSGGAIQSPQVFLNAIYYPFLWTYFWEKKTLPRCASPKLVNLSRFYYVNNSTIIEA